MPARLAIAPGSWGVEPPGDPGFPPRDTVLDEMRDAGYRYIELGPVGYLPEDPDELRAALEGRGLELVAGFAMEPFHRPEARESTLRVVERTCRALRAGGGTRLLLIESLVPERAATLGDAAAAPRLDAGSWRTLLETIAAAAELARRFGLLAAFHPHAGTVVEFRDEVDRLMEEVEAWGVGLCVDTAHSVIAGIDPVGLIRAYGPRVNHVHLKDVDERQLAQSLARRASFEEGVSDGIFCRLGDGCVAFGAVAEALSEVGFDGWATIEQDRLPGDPAALEDASRSRSYAQGAGFR
jgi:inosose dehydratase